MFAERHQRGFIISQVRSERLHAGEAKGKVQKYTTRYTKVRRSTGRTINSQCIEVDGRIHEHIGHMDSPFSVLIFARVKLEFNVKDNVP